MTDKKITDLSAASAFDGTELFETVQGGTNKKGLISAIYTYIDGLINGFTASGGGSAGNWTATPPDEGATITLHGANSIASGNGGSVILTAGDGVGASNGGGDMALQAGSNTDTGGNGGNVTLLAGNGDATAGSVTLVGGAAAAGAGGNVFLSAGSSLGGDGDGGDVFLIGGSPDGAGRAGLIRVLIPDADPGIFGAIYHTAGVLMVSL